MPHTYARFWPGGWQNLPSTATPIMAAALDGIDQGITDALTDAAAAQATATTALAAAGDGIFAIPGLVLDGTTDDGPAIQAALELVEDNARGAHLLVHGNAGQKCFIDSTVTISASGTILDFDVPVVMGASGRFRPWGIIDEEPKENPAKPALTADAPAGATVLQVTAVPAGWAVGDFVGVRGRRTASGSVPVAEIFYSYVSALNPSGPTITLADPLPKQFLALWDTTFRNKLTQITKVTQSKLTGTPTAGDVTINCVDTAVFAVGDVVQVIDGTETVTGNPRAKEVATVAEIVSPTTMNLSHALYHSYSLAADARVMKLLVLEDAEIRNLRVTHSAQGAAGTHAIEVRYARNVRVRNYSIHGGGDDGVSWSAHALRFTDSLDCFAQGLVISGPSDVTAGRGYGVSFYGATNCWVADASITGTRHAVLWFAAASGNEARNVISTDCRISDFDWHGAGCNWNRTTSCTAVGGTRNTDDSSVRSAWKYGNPAHQAPDTGNVATDCLVVNYAGVAVEGLPAATDSSWQGVVRGADIGIKVVPLPLDATETLNGFIIRDSEFYDVPTPFQVDGGIHNIVEGLVVDNVRWHRCGPIALLGAPGARFTRNTITSAALGSAYVFSATVCDGIHVKGNDFSAAARGIELTDCLNARVTRNDLHDLTASTIVLRDGGGNTGILFRDNDTIGYTATRSNAGTPSTGTVVL